MENLTVRTAMLNFVNDFMVRITKKENWSKEDIHNELCYVMFETALKYVSTPKEREDET